MVELSKIERLQYKKAQPKLWRYAGKKEDAEQFKYFQQLKQSKNCLMFTAYAQNSSILGFLIGNLIKAPAVYDLKGFTLMINDFCVYS